MDVIRKEFKRGQIDLKTYKEKATEFTISHLEAINYNYVGKMADGTHAVIVEMKSPTTALNVAVKITTGDLASENGMILWPKLIHENILPLITWQNIAEANTKAFVSPKCDAVLQNEQASFHNDIDGFEKATSCIRDIANGINYIHQEGLCHLNIHPNHIFMDCENTTKLGGFCHLASSDRKEFEFGTSAIFHPPEVFHANKENIDGQKFDIWSLGILTMEMFTGHYLTKKISKYSVQPISWYFEFYKEIYSILEEEKFKNILKENFPNSKETEEKFDQILNFIKSCLIFNPGDRPSASDLLKHRLLGGHIEKYRPKENGDIWCEKVSPIDLLMLGTQNSYRTMSKSSEKDDKENQGEPIDKCNISSTENFSKNFDENWKSEMLMETSPENEKSDAIERTDDIFMESNCEKLNVTCCNEEISLKNETSVQHINLEPMESSNFVHSNTPVFESSTSSQNFPMHIRSECNERKVKRKLRKKNLKTFSVGNMDENPDEVKKENGVMKKEKVSRKVPPKQENEFLYASTNEEQVFEKSIYRKQKSARKTHPPKSMNVQVCQCPITSEQDYEDYDLEPGEIPFFRKDYEKVLDANNDEIEEGEIIPNNSVFACDSSPRQDRKRFKKLRSWWKKRKNTFASLFRSCISESPIN